MVNAGPRLEQKTCLACGAPFVEPERALSWCEPVCASCRPRPRWPCTACGGDATLAYSAAPGGERWDRVKPGERLCSRCYRARGGRPFFG